MSTVGTTTTPSVSGQQPLPKGTQITAASGRSYVVDEVLSKREGAGRLWCLYRASHGGKQYILKDIIPGDFDYILSLQKLVEHSSRVRTVVDTVPDRHIFVYPQLERTLLGIERADPSATVKKRILRDALIGLADMHDKVIYHTDIKPTNIMMDSFRRSDGTLDFRNVQITDLEDAVVIPPKTKGLADRLSGNHYWRSPEAWARGIQHTSSDIFSFGIVAIYVWLGRMVFFSEEANQARPEEQARLILRTLVRYFVDDVDDFEGFVKYHGGEDAPFVKTLIDLIATFSGEEKRKPFHKWYPMDPQFKDLVGRMTYMDPRRRITAREALQHPWFADCEDGPMPSVASARGD